MFTHFQIFRRLSKGFAVCEVLTNFRLFLSRTFVLCRLLNYDLTPTKKAQELAFVLEHNIEGALGVFFMDAKEADCENIIETWTQLGPQKQKMSLETIMTKVLMSLGYGQTMDLLKNLSKEKGTFSPR